LTHLHPHSHKHQIRTHTAKPLVDIRSQSRSSCHPSTFILLPSTFYLLPSTFNFQPSSFILAPHTLRPTSTTPTRPPTTDAWIPHQNECQHQLLAQCMARPSLHPTSFHRVHPPSCVQVSSSISRSLQHTYRRMPSHPCLEPRSTCGHRRRLHALRWLL